MPRFTSNSLNSDGLWLEILILPAVLLIAAVSGKIAKENDVRNKLGLGEVSILPSQVFPGRSRSVPGAQLSVCFTVLSVSVTPFALVLHSSSERRKASAPH